MRAKQDAGPDSIILALDKVNNTHNNFESGIQSGAYLQLVFFIIRKINPSFIRLIVKEFV